MVSQIRFTDIVPNIAMDFYANEIQLLVSLIYNYIVYNNYIITIIIITIIHYFLLYTINASHHFTLGIAIFILSSLHRSALGFEPGE